MCNSTIAQTSDKLHIILPVMCPQFVAISTKPEVIEGMGQIEEETKTHTTFAKSHCSMPTNLSPFPHVIVCTGFKWK